MGIHTPVRHPCIAEEGRQGGEEEEGRKRREGGGGLGEHEEEEEKEDGGKVWKEAKIEMLDLEIDDSCLAGESLALLHVHTSDGLIIVACCMQVAELYSFDTVQLFIPHEC